MRKLRAFQRDTTLKIKAKLSEGVTRQVVKYATGLGKTPLFSALPEELGFTKRMLVVVHREELNNQALDKLKSWNPTRSIGVEMGDRHSNGEQLVAAGNATIGHKGSPRLVQFDPRDFDCLVIDECHHGTSQSYRTIISHFTQNPKLLVLGVTATPNRADGTGLGEVFQEIVDDKDILYGINNGWLADLRGIRIRTGVDLNGVRNKAGDFDQQELGSTVNTPARNNLIVRSWLEHAKDRQTVMFTVNIQHAKDLAAAFKSCGVSAEGIWGDDPDRKFKLKCHRDGTIKVLLNCQLLTEGYDDWSVSCIGDAAPTQSESRYTQKIGRGTRIPDDIENLLTARHAGQVIRKEDCIVLDFVDATSKHSLVTLPTLFGMGANTDLRGKAISKIAAEIAQVMLKNPFLDLSKVDDVDQLQSYAEQVDLFKGAFSAEILDISELQWHRSSANMYLLMLPNREHLAVASDILGRWHILGDINQCKVRDWRPTFEEAIREADLRVGMLGPNIKRLLSRKPEPHDEPPEPPTAAQLRSCGWNNIAVPPGATKAEVALKLSRVAQERRMQRDSVVHGRWLLVRLLRLSLLAPSDKVRLAVGRSLAPANIAQEVIDINARRRNGFQCPYSLAWLLQLAAELKEFDDPEARQWSAALRPLEHAAVARAAEWLLQLRQPIRTGEHNNTAFSMGLMLDYARIVGNTEFGRFMESRTRDYYWKDRNCPSIYDPSGEFLSPCLAEADVMRRILPSAEFAKWFTGFLPRADMGPMQVRDVTDGEPCHQVGLNLSRAWMLEGIVSKLPTADARRQPLTELAAKLKVMGMKSIRSEHYEGGHWLAIFAAYLASGRGLR